MKKRWMAAVVSLALCISMLAVGAVTASAQTAATLTVAMVSGQVGDVVEVPITISEGSYLVNGDLYITYDDTKLALDATYYPHPDDEEQTRAFQVNTAMFSAGWMYDGNANESGVFRLVTASGGKNGITVGGEMFRLAFRILTEDVSFTAIELTANPFNGNDGTGEVDDNGFPMDMPIALTVVNGGVTVKKEYVPGDINSDGQVDMRDAFAVYRAAAGSGVTAEIAAYADMNTDGQIDMRDAFAVYRIASGAV